MNGLAAASSAVAAPGISPVDRWISRAATATVVGLAGIAGAISYSHMRELAQEHGQAGWHGHAFPLSVDGIEIVASLVLLADRRASRRSGWLPWAALVIGTAGSLAANVATAGPATISRLIAGWPALALLIAVKLLSGLLDRDTARRPAVPVAVPSHGLGGDAVLGDDASVPACRPRPARPPGRRVPGRDHSLSPPLQSGSVPPARRGVAAGLRAAGPSAAAGPGTAPGVAAMLPAARAARDGLHRDGLPVTRDALAARLRQDGHPVRNSRLTPLLQALRSEPADQAGRLAGTEGRAVTGGAGG
jgi:hypothetical protein